MAKNPLRGDNPWPRCALCYEMMRVRFLLSGLTLFAIAVVMAALPVVAHGHNVPSKNQPCTISGTGGADVLTGTSGADVICGFGGADIITAHGGNDVVKGGAGSDTIYGDTGRDVLLGGRGNDSLYARDSEHDHLYGGRGSDYGRVDNPLDTRRSVEST